MATQHDISSIAVNQSINQSINQYLGDAVYGALLAIFGTLHDQAADALFVDHLEGVLVQDACLEVSGQEGADVVAREAEGHLREIIGTVRKELGAVLGKFASYQGSAGYLDLYSHVDQIRYGRWGINNEIDFSKVRSI